MINPLIHTFLWRDLHMSWGQVVVRLMRLIVNNKGAVMEVARFKPQGNYLPPGVKIRGMFKQSFVSRKHENGHVSLRLSSKKHT